MNINHQFSTDTAKKIFGNKENALNFLEKLQQIKNIELPYKNIRRGKNKGQKKIDLDTNEIWRKILETWNTKIALSIIREMFEKTKKYKSGIDSNKTMSILLNEWNKLNLGNISWPFSQGDFDGFVQRINNTKNDSGDEKDKKVKNAAVKYRRIKEINTVRNDFIETLIFQKNQNILPTLNHRRGVDFFINGISFDQKVAKSPTKEFQKDFGENWKQKAINNPEKVAQYLYKYQDEGRFGADSRLLVVYLDEDVSIEKIKNTIDKTDLNTPLIVNFDYKHNKGKPTEKTTDYRVSCFIILLHN